MESKVERKSVIIKTSILALATMIIGCKEEKVDLAEYLIPSQYNGNVRVIYGDLISDKLDYEDAITITDFSQGEISSDQYKIYTDQAMKTYGKENKMHLTRRMNTRYVFDKDTFYVAQSNNNSIGEEKFTFDRFITPGKTYNSFANIYGNRARTEEKYGVESSYEKKIIDKKDCLVNTVINSFPKGFKVKMDFTYCKPYGLVLHNLYQKDGEIIINKEFRKSEEQ